MLYLLLVVTTCCLLLSVLILLRTQMTPPPSLAVLEEVAGALPQANTPEEVNVLLGEAVALLQVAAAHPRTDRRALRVLYGRVQQEQTRRMQVLLATEQAAEAQRQAAQREAEAQKQAIEQTKQVNDLLMAGDRALDEGHYRDGLLAFQAVCRQHPQTPNSLPAYLSAVRRVVPLVSTDEGTRLVVDAERELQQWALQQPATGLVHAHQAHHMLSEIRDELQQTIRHQREQAFAGVIGEVKRLTTGTVKATSNNELIALREQADRLGRTWGHMSASEALGWKTAYDQLMQTLVKRNEDFQSTEAERVRAESLSAARSASAKLTQELTSLQKEATAAKNLQSLAETGRRFDRLRKPDIEVLPTAEQDVLIELTRRVQAAIQDVGAQISNQLRNAYNQTAVREIDQFLGRLKQVPESGRVSGAVQLVGNFGSIDTNLLDVPTLQYYQLALNKALEVLDESSEAQVMLQVATMDKRKLEG